MVKKEEYIMQIATAEIRLFIPWVHSLKEKRMVLKSLLDRMRAKFNVSAAEVAEQDIHQIAVLGVAAIAGDSAQADSILDTIIRFIEGATEAEITAVSREMR